MGNSTSETFFQYPGRALIFTFLFSFAIHIFLFSWELRSSSEPSNHFRSERKPLFLSSNQGSAFSKGLVSFSNDRAKSTREIKAAMDTAEPLISNLGEALNEPTPKPSTTKNNPFPPPESLTDESESVLPSLLNEPIFPGGSPNRGKWGRQAIPTTNQVKQSGNQGYAFVVPFLQSLTTYLEPKASCDIKVSVAWSAALVSCTDRQYYSLIAGHFSQQLQIMESLPGAGYCFHVNHDGFTALACN